MKNSGIGSITAVVLAAGLSSRMGVQKLLLPWQGSSVIGTVIASLEAAGIIDIIVVTGRDADAVAGEVRHKARAVHNPDYANGNMVDSLKAGISAVLGSAGAVLVALGDQPQMEVETIRKLVSEWQLHNESLCLPSWQMKRGHPWIIPARMLAEITGMQTNETMRDFMRRHENDIHYVLVDTPSIIADLDTPEDYRKLTGG